MEKKLLVISIDSFITEDLEIMKTLPNFSRVLGEASVVKRNLTTYPTLTHSIHTTIQTGCRPGKHGVVNNEWFRPYSKTPPPWFDDAADIQVPTFAQECATQLGATTALVFWPLIRGADADWVIVRPGVGGPHGAYADAEDELVKTSTPGIYTGRLYERCKGAWELPHYYDWDEFSARACEQMIYLHQPDVMITHWTVIDAERHALGVFNERIRPAYEALDRGLGYILKALDDTGLWGRTILCITSDHGQLDITRSCRPNAFLAGHNLITLNADGSLQDYEIYCHGSGLCCQVYLKDASAANVGKAKRFFLAHRKELGFSELFGREELMERYGLEGDFSFVLETDGETGFVSDLQGEVLSPITGGDYRSSAGSHGHCPEKGVQPCLIVRNPFRADKVTLEHGYVIDQAPTFAAMLGASMPQADGKPMAELI